jgi:hypothetical protein
MYLILAGAGSFYLIHEAIAIGVPQGSVAPCCSLTVLSDPGSIATSFRNLAASFPQCPPSFLFFFCIDIPPLFKSRAPRENHQSLDPN